MQLKQANPQITDSALRMPGDVPEIPPEVIERFPEMAVWMDNFKRFWSQNTNAINDFARAVLDVTEIGGLFVVDGTNHSIYIKGTRDRGAYDDTDTPFYADKKGFFSLGSHLTWNPETLTLTIDGTIYAEAGNIGGFEIGPDFIRDEGDSFGLSSDSSGAAPWVRFWAGDTFANRGSAPFRVYSDGSIFASMGTIGGWIITTTALAGTNAVLAAAGTLILGTVNDVAILDANDATYRLWIGNATAGTATFSVTKTGALFSTSGTIGGFTISATSLSASSGPTTISLSTVITAGLSVGEPAGLRSVHRAGTGGTSASFYLFNSSNTLVGAFEAQSTHEGARLTLNNTSGTQLIDIDIDALVAKSTITFDGDTNLYRDSADVLKTDDAFVATGFTGDGSQLTALNASNISSGTLNDARLSFSPGNLASRNVGAFVGSVDVPIIGSMTIPDSGGTTRKVAIVA